MTNDVFTLDENNNAAIRTLGAKAGTAETNSPSVFTEDENGNAAIRVTGGGGDQNNLGYFATLQALQEAYPTAEPGNWAIVGATDTVWIWDEDTSAWVDSDQKGQVTSVNNQTGAVTVQETLVSGTNIKTIDGNSVLGSGNLELSTYLTYPAGWTTNSTTKAFCDDIAADTSAVVGKAYLGEVTCSDLPASMVNGEIVVEIMDGTTAANKVIVLSLKSGNVSPYAWQYVYWNGGSNTSGWKTWQETLVSGTNIKTINGTSLLGSGDLTVSGLPSQTGNAGKFLTTDGTDASWSDKPLVNVATNSTSLIVGGASTSNGQATGFGKSSFCGWAGTAVGTNARAIGNGALGSVAVGNNSRATDLMNANLKYATAIGSTATAENNCAMALGGGAKATGTGSIQINASETTNTNSDANTFKVANANGNYEMMSADGTVPTDRFTTTPSVAGTYSATIVVDGQGNITRSWATAPDPLPSQTGNAGKVLMTNGTTASWEDVSSSPTTAPTLVAANWSSNQQTVNVTGVTATNTVIVAPIPTDAQDYATAGILCIGQGAGTLTFSCTSVPANDLQVNVVII